MFIKSHITAECISYCARSSSFGTGEEQRHWHGHSSPHLSWRLGHSISLLLGPLPLALWTTSFLQLHTGPSVVPSNEKFLIQPELMHCKCVTLSLAVLPLLYMFQDQAIQVQPYREG